MTKRDRKKRMETGPDSAGQSGAISSEEKSGAPQPMSTSPPKRIVILGGGFAGLYAAMELEKTLARDPEVEITLVNRENFFLFTPMLHEVAASDLDITAIVNPVLRKNSMDDIDPSFECSAFAVCPLVFHSSGPRCEVASSSTQSSSV